jgi:hypothetical protein
VATLVYFFPKNPFVQFAMDFCFFFGSPRWENFPTKKTHYLGCSRGICIWIWGLLQMLFWCTGIFEEWDQLPKVLGFRLSSSVQQLQSPSARYNSCLESYT